MGKALEIAAAFAASRSQRSVRSAKPEREPNDSQQAGCAREAAQRAPRLAKKILQEQGIGVARVLLHESGQLAV